eukprot:6261972-Amphidinium_carterae.1
MALSSTLAVSSRYVHINGGLGGFVCRWYHTCPLCVAASFLKGLRVELKAWAEQHQGVQAGGPASHRLSPAWGRRKGTVTR